MPDEDTPLKSDDGKADGPTDWPKYFADTFSDLFFGSKLNILLVFVPLSFVSKYVVDGTFGQLPPDQPKNGAAITFCCCLLSMCPLAERMGHLTDKLADYINNQMLAGLLNASCGNVPELIVTVAAISQNHPDIVQQSLIGGVFSNLLLVAGLSFFFGGLLHKRQTYNAHVSSTFIGLLLIPSLAIMMAEFLPTNGVVQAAQNGTLFNATTTDRNGNTISQRIFPFPGFAARPGETITSQWSPALDISRVLAVVLIIAYLIVLILQLWTHRDDFHDADEDAVDKGADNGGDAADKGGPFPCLQAGKGVCACISADGGDDDDDDGPDYGVYGAITWLLLITVLVSFISDFMVGAIQQAATEMHLYQSFVTAIILPNISNACEHAVSIWFAMRGKLNTSVAISVGSASQLAAFVFPLSILIGWAANVDLSMQVPKIFSGSLLISTLIASATLNAGKTTWASGALLIITYAVITAGLFYVPTDDARSVGHAIPVDLTPFAP